MTNALVAAYAADQGKPMKPSIEPVTSAQGPKRSRKSSAISRSRCDAFEDQLPQQRRVHLLRRRRPGQLREKAHVPRLLVAGEVLTDVRHDLLGRECRPVAKDDGRHDRLAPFWIGNADHAGLADLRVRDEDALDLGGEDALAAAPDHLLAAPDDREEPLGVERPEITREHPAVTHRARGLLRVPP